MSLLCRNDFAPGPNGFLIWLPLIATILIGEVGFYNFAAAANWEVRPDVDVGAQYQSNPRFRINDPESATGLFIAAGLPVNFHNQRTQASLHPRLTRNFYRKEINQDIERENYYFDANVGHAMPRSGFGASARYTDLDLIASEFDDGGGSGVPARLDIRQKTWDINPYWSYQLSPANTVALNGGISQTRFNQLTRSRFNYDYNNLSATFSHVFNEKNSIDLRANFSKFDSFQPFTTVENDSTTNGLSAIFSNNFSESLSFTANLGWARTQSEVTFPSFNIPGQGDFCFDGTRPPCINNTDSTNFVGDLALQKHSESLAYFVSIGQTLTPNSNGSEVLRRTLKGNFRKDFRRNFSATLDLNAYRQIDAGATDEDGSSSLDRKRDYVRTRAKVSWKFRRELALSASYQYTWSRQSGFVFFTPGTITDNTVFIGLSYKGKGWQ
jgi:hypothetical protein